MQHIQTILFCLLGINVHTQGKVACVISYTDGGTLLVGSRKLERIFPVAQTIYMYTIYKKLWHKSWKSSILIISFIVMWPSLYNHLSWRTYFILRSIYQLELIIHIWKANYGIIAWCIILQDILAYQLVCSLTH